MGFARAADVPVVLAGDIDRGHVIAALVGAHTVLAHEDRAMIQGFLINKFRGDPALFDAGRAEIVRRTGWPDLGMAPWLAAARRLPAEDAVVLQAASTHHAAAARVKIVVPLLPSIANFDDFDALRSEAAVDFGFLPPGRALPGDVDLVILAGAKATVSDLARLRAEGWDVDLAAHVRRGGRVLGVCGGYQMLGRRIADPDGTGGAARVRRRGSACSTSTRGCPGDKTLRRAEGRLASCGAAEFEGYEIHMSASPTARTRRARCSHMADGRADGAVSRDGRVAGGYVHGLFDHGEARRALAGRARRGVERARPVRRHRSGPGRPGRRARLQPRHRRPRKDRRPLSFVAPPPSRRSILCTRGAPEAPVSLARPGRRGRSAGWRPWRCRSAPSRTASSPGWRGSPPMSSPETTG